MAETKEAGAPARDMTSITTTRDFARRIREIADHRDITMADVLEKYGTSLYTEHRKVTREKFDALNEELGGEG